MDFAITYDLKCGGYCPKGRKAEDGIINNKYPLKETDSSKYEQRTRLNVLKSDGTLIIYDTVMDKGTLLTLKTAKDNNIPYFLIDIKMQSSIEQIRQWISENKINTLNIAGSRESVQPGIYSKTFLILQKIFLSKTKQ